MGNCCRWPLLFVMALVACQFARATEDKPSDKQEATGIPAFTPSDTTRLEYADGKWVVWTVRDQFGDPRLRAIPFRTRYFRQKLAERDGSLVFEMRGTNSRNVATVLDDGTLVLAYFTQLDWVLPDGSTASERPTIDGKECRILQGHPDGLLLQPSNANQKGPIYYVPIVNRKLNIAGKIELTDQEGASVNSPPRILRSGNQIAFDRYVFDLQKRKRVELTVPAGSIATAFDGATLVLATSKGHVALSLADGAEQLVDELQLIRSRVFVVRNRVGYFLAFPNAKDSDALVLKAVRLFEPERGATELARFPFKGGRVGLFNVDVPYVETDKGLVNWDGKTWQVIPWLETLNKKAIEPSIVFDNRPEAGVPREALAQKLKLTAQEELLPAKGYPVKFHALTDGTIKTVRIRYFNKETWKSEKEAREYVAGFLGNKSSAVFGFQIWSQGVGVPEIECIVESTDEHRKKLLAENKECREGRLLLWNTESCFRDATGRWWFVDAFDQFHSSHPKGDRKLSKNPKKCTPPQFVGKWTVTFAKEVVETCDVRANWTASESEPKRLADGKAEVKGNALVITFTDDRVERWTIVDKRVVVEHFFPGTEFPAGARVLGIADRVP